MIRNFKNRNRGLTLTELLVVMLIIGLLASIAVPVYVRRQEDARVRIALAECREIAEAEEQVAVLHGFYVPIRVLDDLPPPPAGVATITGEERINQEPFNFFLIDPLVRAQDQINNQPQYNDQFSASPYAARVANLVNNWSGPFMNFQRFYTDAAQRSPTDPIYRNSSALYLDFPLDPWGNPYRFYSSAGVIGTQDYGVFNPNTGANQNFGDGRLTTLDANRFDRYAIVSYGRDGISDTQAITLNYRDDVFYIFGTDGVESNFGRVF